MFTDKRVNSTCSTKAHQTQQNTNNTNKTSAIRLHSKQKEFFFRYSSCVDFRLLFFLFPLLSSLLLLCCHHEWVPLTGHFFSPWSSRCRPFVPVHNEQTQKSGLGETRKFYCFLSRFVVVIYKRILINNYMFVYFNNIFTFKCTYAFPQGL